jgi:glycosyltransferase involved in cell wall biosynthesis
MALLLRRTRRLFCAVVLASMEHSPPLLSICIPTYNRAALLEVCLASVLPQAAQFSRCVECVISDNASSDNTAEVIERYQRQYPLRYSRNDTNIGIIGNITKVASELAEGEYVWLLGDDDVMTAGAIERLVAILKPNPQVDLVALNVGFAAGENRPTADAALTGIDAGAALSTLRKATQSGVVAFEQLFEGPCADLTAMYSLAMRRQLWRNRYPKASVETPFTSVDSTYPHAAIIAEQLPGKLAGLISQPAVMIYEMPSSQFSWARHHSRCVMLYCTELLWRYVRTGVPYRVMEPYFIYQLLHRSSELGDLAFNRQTAGGLRDALKVTWMLRRYPKLLLRAWAIALLHPQAPKILSAPIRAWQKWR